MSELLYCCIAKATKCQMTNDQLAMTKNAKLFSFYQNVFYL